MVDNLYGDEHQPSNETPEEESVQVDYSTIYDELTYGIGFDDSVIQIHGEIEDGMSLSYLISAVRAILNKRKIDQLPPELQKAPITLILNSPGGSLFEMFGIVDYLQGLTVKINVVCRGQALSAGGIILATMTGHRIASKHTTIMFHDGLSDPSGKHNELVSFVDHGKKLHQKIYAMLESKTKKPAEFWKQSMATDFWLTADEALELGVIDKII